MIWVTGDTHGEIDWHKLNMRNFKQQEIMTSRDFVIICGDFGGLWTEGSRDTAILNSYAARNFTTLFVDGNHENFDLINAYPVTIWNGGKVHKIRDNLIHLMRGQVFTIDGMKFFTFGGGTSIDKMYRQEGRSWWPQEIPTVDEIKEGTNNLAGNNWNVDYVLTHAAPTRICAMLNVHKIDDPLCEILDNFEKHLTFKRWFFGHYHRDFYRVPGEPKFTALYNDMMRLEYERDTKVSGMA